MPVTSKTTTARFLLSCCLFLPCLSIQNNVRFLRDILFYRLFLPPILFGCIGKKGQAKQHKTQD